MVHWFSKVLAWWWFISLPPQGVSSLAREIKRLRRGERLDLKGRVDGGVLSIPYDDIAIVKDVVRYNYV